MTTFPLGHVGPRPRVAGDPRRRLLALAGADAIVLVGTRLPGGWACHVIARRRPDKRPRRVVLTDTEIDDAVTEVDADRNRDPDTYAMVWLARVHTSFPANNISPVARVMAEQIRRPGSLTIDLDHHAVSRLAVAARRRADRLDRVLQRFVDHELLAAETPPGDGWARYQLTIPTPDRRGKPGPQHSSPPLVNRPTALTRLLKEHRMPPPDPHPHWCTAVDCARSGIHESAPVVAGDQDEILGVAVARVRIGESIDAVTVAFTDDGTTTYTIPAAQARAFTQTIDRLLTA